MTAEHPECAGSGLDRATYMSVDDLLAIAEEQADDPDVLSHIRRARQQTRVPAEVRES
jgi:hypothetical protein